MNIFQRICASLRRKKKGKPVPVVPEPPIKAVTYNRVDGLVSGGVLVEHRPPLQQTPRSGRVVWDPASKVHKGKTYNRRADTDDFVMYAESTEFDDTFFYESGETASERGYTAPESASGYDYPSQSVSSSYVDRSPFYEAPTSSWGDSTSNSGSSHYSSSPVSYSGDSGGSSGYSSGSSDSGGSSGGGE